MTVETRSGVFPPNTQVTVSIEAQILRFRQDLGTATTDSAGLFSATFTIPATIPTQNLGAITAVDSPVTAHGSKMIGLVSAATLTSDVDADGFADGCDNCPSDPQVDQLNSDADKEGDVCDPCPFDRLNDSDGDGACADVDPWPFDPDNDQDGDGISGHVDNCPTVSNPTQLDADANGIGDECQTMPTCLDTIDNDRDGLIDGADPGCSNAGDVSERDPLLPCDNGLDDDGDSRIDFVPGAIGVGDPGCQNPSSPSEDPQCDNNVDDDLDGGIDFDGGTRGIRIDPACVNQPWHDSEATLSGADADGDGILDGSDNCPSVRNTDQADGDADRVGDACDNCPKTSNPRVSPATLAANPWMTVTGGQRDDDADGIGNKCDGKFPGVLGFLVSPLDSNEMTASIGKPLSSSVCGTSGTLPCAIFDLDELGFAVVTPLDTNYYVTNLLGNDIRDPTEFGCQRCPLLCEGANCP